MLFTQRGAPFYDDEDRRIISRMETDYSNTITLNQAYWVEADTDLRFWANDQTIYSDIYGNVPLTRRRHFTFNRIRPIVSGMSGYQRRNRKSTAVIPVENADQQTADQFTKVLTWAKNTDNILETFSDACEGALITGMNLLQIWLDYRADPISGNIRVSNCWYNSFLIDPYFRNPDLSDCNFIWKRSYLTKQECVSLLPEYTDDILAMIGVYGGNEKDFKFQFMPETYNYAPRNLIPYDEYYYRDYRTQKLLFDSKTGETTEWKGQDEERLKHFLATFPQIRLIESIVPTVRVAIVVANKVVYDGPNPLGIDEYPFVPVLAYYTPQLPYFQYRVQGVVRAMRDAQFLYNRRKVIELDMMESQINSGWKYKENALVNPRDVFLSGQGKGLALKEEAAMTDVEQIVPPPIAPSLLELSKIIADEMAKISGFNEELLGSAMDDKAGVLSMLRQGAGLTTLQNLFDGFDRSQKLLGKRMVEIIQTNFTPGKIQKILQDQPSDFFYNKSFGKYDVAIEEGFNTTTQKQMEFAQLLQLKELGVPIPDSSLIEAATLQNKTKLIQAMEQQQQQAQQMQQQQAQLAMQELQAKTNLANARAEADRGLGIERISRVEENRALAVERVAQAEKERDLALLNTVKALKEIETVDITQLEKLVTLANLIKQAEVGQAAPGG
jgi:hypothetical protein